MLNGYEIVKELTDHITPSNQRKKRARFRCLACQNEWDADRWRVINNKRGCPACAKQKKFGNTSPSWKGGKHVPGVYLSFISRPPNDRSTKMKEVSVTIEDLDDAWERQEGLCALSGVKLNLQKNGRNASVDRIDSDKGYIKGNIQWVHKYINKMKQDLPDDLFVEWCGKVYLNK